MSPGVQAIRGPKRDRFFNFRVTDAERAQIVRNGGGKWIRKLIRTARFENAAKELVSLCHEQNRS